MKASPAPRTLNTSIGKPWPLMPSSMSRGDRAVEQDAAHRAALDHDQRLGRELADAAAGGERVGGAAGDVDLLLGADDHVAARKDGLQVGRDARVGDEALLAEAMAGQAPEHRAVVDVEDHPAAVLPGEAHRTSAHGIEVGLGEVGARDHDRAGRRDVVLLDVVLGQRRIGAVLAHEDQGEGMAVADAEDHQRREPQGIGLDAPDVDPLGRGLLLDEAPHVLVADRGDQAGPEPEPGGADRDVGRDSRRRTWRSSPSPRAARRPARHRGRPRSGRCRSHRGSCSCPSPIPAPSQERFQPRRRVAESRRAGRGARRRSVGSREELKAWRANLACTPESVGPAARATPHREWHAAGSPSGAIRSQ